MAGLPTDAYAAGRVPQAKRVTPIGPSWGRTVEVHRNGGPRTNVLERRWPSPPVDRLTLALLLAGLALIDVVLWVQGLGFLGHVWDHVVRDVTVELWTHLLLLGIVLVVYGAWRQGRRRFVEDDPARP